MKPKMHMKSRRLFVNTGMSFPLCYANRRFLDTDKDRLYTTYASEDVTCKSCRKLMKKGEYQ